MEMRGCCLVMGIVTLLASIANCVLGSVTNAPWNTVSLAGQKVTFQCTTNTTTRAVYWQFTNVNGVLQPPIYPGGMNPAYATRGFSVSNSSSSLGTEYNLTIARVNLTDAGTYTCQDNDGIGEARAAWLTILDADPECSCSGIVNGVTNLTCTASMYNRISDTNRLVPVGRWSNCYDACEPSTTLTNDSFYRQYTWKSYLNVSNNVSATSEFSLRFMTVSVVSDLTIDGRTPTYNFTWTSPTTCPTIATTTTTTRTTAITTSTVNATTITRSAVNASSISANTTTTSGIPFSAPTNQWTTPIRVNATRTTRSAVNGSSISANANATGTPFTTTTTPWTSPTSYDGLVPAMLGDPEFVGPIAVTKSGSSYSNYTDFYFECRVKYNNRDNNSRFDVFLTFDGQRDDSNVDTHVTTNSSALVVFFYSITIRGNVGKSVSCEVQSFWLGSAVKSDPRHSANSYWVGVSFSTDERFFNAAENRIEITSSDWLEIEFRPTVPLAISDCSDLDLDFEQTGLQTSSCKVSFGIGSSEYRLAIQAEPRPGCEPFTAVLTFLAPLPRGVTTIWDDYVVVEIKIVVECSRPQMLCQSYHEPLIVTFDGVRYLTWAYPGDFLLYRSNISNRLFEVHARHVACYPGSPSITCNCAVVVREGNDALGVYACDGAVTPIRYMKDSNTPDGQADITYKRISGKSSSYGDELNYCYDDTGDVYEIIMPSGSLVRVRVWDTGNGYLCLNVYIYAHPGYAGGTGLCGNYNLDYSDDAAEFGDFDWGMYYSEPGMEKYRLSETESYINGYVYPLPCVASPEPSTQCQCQGRTAKSCSGAEDRRSVPSFITQFTDRCSATAPNQVRKKRQTESAQTQPMITQNDIPLPPPFERGATVVPPPAWPTASGITREQAEDKCLSVLHSFPAYDVCLSYIDDSFVNTSCIAQIQLLDNLETGASMMLDDLKQRCRFSIASSVDANSTDPMRQPEAVNAVLESVESHDCPGQPTACSGHGNCTEGVCSCDEGYIGIACAINATAIPVLNRFRRGCQCDSRTDVCNKAYISASDFFSSVNLTCRIRSESDPGFSFDSSPGVVSSMELSCPLPRVTAAMTVLDISVSNDGERYSNELQMTIYDSLCLECNCTQCTQNTSACYIDGQCFGRGNGNPTNSALLCDPSENISAWSTNECMSNPCMNAATCVDGVSSYRCICDSLHSGVNCESGLTTTTTTTTTAKPPAQPAPQPAPKKRNKKTKKNKKSTKRRTKKRH